MKSSRTPEGYVTFALHSHLPYVVHHGTWPHGLDWLHEAAAETYLPLLRTFRELERAGTALHANVNLSPVLLEQLSHPTFKEEFVVYAQRKIDAAEQDEREFRAQGESHFADVARFWNNFFRAALEDFEALGRDIVGGFKRFYDSGAIEIITCGATHGYFPLLGTDASIRAQVRLGVETHKRFFGRAPRGIWLPECGYRPSGQWCYPVSLNGASRPCFVREGVERILRDNGIQYFFVDTHLVEGNVKFSPYEMIAGNVPIALESEDGEPHPSLYHPYYAGVPRRAPGQPAAFFTRDPRTGIQVWSGEHGYPGDGVYLDFHKKHWPGGHRYWQVTSPRVDLGQKTAYYPERALAKTREHAAHFRHVTEQVIANNAPHNGSIPVLTAPFDAELFGHWWFEGTEWLKNVALEYAQPSSKIELISCAEYLDRFPPSGYLALPEGSWGKNGTNEVWLNADTAWTWKHIYPAEFAVEQMAMGGKWRGNEVATRLASQLCRELLLLESSDWQFLITTQHARDYAEKRFQTHLDQFRALLDAWRRFESSGEIPAEAQQKLGEIERRDSIFPTVRPELYV